MSSFLLSLFFALAGTSNASGHPAPKSPAKPEVKAAAPLVQTFCIFGGQSGKPFGDLASFKSVIWKSDVVYAGGNASQFKAQEARLDILKSMREARSSKIAVGFEALDFTQQPALDDYAAGKITEDEFLQKTGWQAQAGADFPLYRPIFNFIIQNKLRALALGAPAPVISRIEREGLAGLGDDEKKFLPAPVNISRHKKYLDFLKASFTAAAPGLTWDNHLAAVSAWDEAAGARIADFLAAMPGYEMLVLAGNDRLIYNAALPASVKSRTVKLRQASFYSEEEAKCPEELPKEKRDLANYVWYTSSLPEPVPAALIAPTTKQAPAPLAAPATTQVPAAGSGHRRK